MKVIAPWREWDLTSRTKLLEFAEQNQIPIAKDKRGEAPFSVDANLLHSSSEGKVLEDPAEEAPEIVYQRTIRPEDAPDQADGDRGRFRARRPGRRSTAQALSPAALLTRLNELGRANGIGRLDLVENRFVGMKSRGVYETPGGTILLAAHRGDRVHHARPRGGAPEGQPDAALCRADLQRLLVQPGAPDAAGADRREPEAASRGRVRMKLYKGNVTCIGRESPNSLYSMKVVTFEEDQGAYDQFDAQGFIKLNALRLRLGAMAGRKGGAL